MKIKWFDLGRVFALFLVLSYHFLPDIFPGGFIGVDIFFVLSGFLMTALAIDNILIKKIFNLESFFWKRFTRIFLPLVFFVFLILPFTKLINPDFSVNLDKQIASVLSFSTNYYEILHGGNYENRFFPHLFIHTWTLSIEVHFYFLWAVTLYICSKLFKSEYKLRITIFSISFFMAILSLITSRLLLHEKENTFLYFFDLTHCFPIFIGSCIASFSGMKKVPASFFKLTAKIKTKFLVILNVFIASLLFYLSLIVNFENNNLYFWGLLFTTFLSAVSILSFRMLHEKIQNSKERKEISFISDMSYFIYLLHWPIFLIVKNYLSDFSMLPWKTIVITLFLTIVISFLYSRYIENIFSNLKSSFQSAIKFSVLLPIFLVLIGCSFSILQNSPKISTIEASFLFSDVQSDIKKLDDNFDELNRKIKEESTEVSQADKEENNIREKTPDEKIPIKKNKVKKGVLIIGDSITRGVQHYLAKNIPDSQVNAAGSRSMKPAFEEFKKLKAQNQLREFIVLCIGTNALAGDDKVLLQLIDSLPKGHALILMTAFDGRANEIWNSSKLTAFYRTLPKKFPFITIADWNKIASKNLDIYGNGDRVHFAGNQRGNELYTQCIKDAINVAKSKARK